MTLTEEYKRERNAVLLSRDPDALLAFMRKHNPSMALHWSRESVELTMHEAITAVRTLPMEARKVSKQWLTERGYHSFDDGELG